MSEQEIKDLQSEREILSFQGENGPLTPSYFVAKEGIKQSMRLATHELKDKFRDWEILLWLHAGNGILDGELPVDQDLEAMEVAVRDELDQ